MADNPLQPDIEANDESDTGPARVTENPLYEGATPPGYDWPTHGGYLGCLLAVMFSCLLAPLGYIVVGFLGAYLAGPLGAAGVGIAIAVTVVGYLALFVGLTRLGWKMGKRFLREYPQPIRPVWGEDDEESDVVVVESDPAPIVDADTSETEDAGGEGAVSSAH